MTKLTYANTSPYSATPQTNWYLGIYAHRNIPATSEDVVMELGAGYQYRPDKLSNDLYGTPVYWWVFAVRNPSVIRDPIWDFKTGIVFIAPSVGALRSLAN